MSADRPPHSDPEVERATGAAETAERRLLILVVDDDPDFTRGLGEVLEGRGYRARCVSSGRDALLMLEGERPALILINPALSALYGADLLIFIKRSPTLSSIPRVIMADSNDLMVSVRQDAPVLYKPLDVDALMEHLRRYCEPPASGGLRLRF